MEDRGPQLAAVSIAFLVTSWLLVSLRVFIRGWMIKSFGLDDWLMAVTLVLFTMYTSFVLLGVSHGTGQHISALTAVQVSKALKAWWFCEIFYGLSTCALKIAIGAFLLRITGKKSHNYVVYSVVALTSIYSVYFLFIIIFQCHPTSHFWNRTAPGSCVNSAIMTNSTYGHSAVSAITDWTFGILPAFIVYDLNMNRRMKISVVALLCFANIGSIATLVRIEYIKQLTATTDFLFVTTDLAIWSSIEVAIGIAAGCIATFRLLFRTFFSKMDTLRSGGHRPPVPAKNSGYKRTRSLTAGTYPERSSPSSTTRITGGGVSYPTESKRWGGRQERYEMDDDLWRVKKSVNIITSEAREL